jgi:hypothetical protein
MKTICAKLAAITPGPLFWWWPQSVRSEALQLLRVHAEFAHKRSTKTFDVITGGWY